MSMGSLLSPVIRDIYMEYFEIALETSGKKPMLWKRYFDDTFVIGSHSEDDLSKFMEHLNGLRP